MIQPATQTDIPSQALTPGAERMRRFRERRREKIRIATLDIWPTEVESLVKLGHLDDAKKENKYELEQALYRFLDQAFPTIEALNAKRP